MKKNMKLVWALFLVMFLAACSYGEDNDTAAPSGDTNTPSSGESDSKQGGKVSIPIVADPTFNPWHPSAYAESNVINRVIFDGLTMPGKDMLPTPNLAEEWETSEDGLVWTFHLREDVKWHDGEKFTAEDVAYTFNEVVLNKDLGANGAANFAKVDNVEVVSDYTVNFNLISPAAALPAYLSFNTEIIPEHIFAGQDPWDLTSFNKQGPIGTGPFKLKKYTSGQSVVLERNEDYFGDVALLDELEYKVLPDANTHVAQLLSGELDIFALDDTSALERIKSAEDVGVYARENPQFFWVIVNQELERYQDVRIRQAIQYSIDRQNIIDTVLNGYGSIADAGIAPALSEYFTDDVKHYEYSPEKARELLAEAGWEDTDGDGFVDKDGENFTINFEIGIQGDLEAMSQLVQQNLITAGFDVELNTMDWNTMIDKVVIQKDYEMSLNWWRYPADPDLLAYMGTGGGRNIPGYTGEKLDELLEAGAKTSNVEERIEIYKEAQQVMSEELPYNFLWFPQEVQVRQNRLQGVPELAFGDSLNYANEWYIEE